MKVKLGQAVKMFFGNSSLEMVYFEAIANSLDAGAKNINIEIRAKAVSDLESIAITISDDGEGFTNERFKKFSNLFDVEESSHKGLGRLVYLCYFSDVKIVSNYESFHQREFDFNDGFNEEDCKISKVDKKPSGTIIKMSNYTLSRLRANSYLQPDYIKRRILEEFYSRLFQLKSKGDSINITIKSVIAGHSTIKTITSSEIPKFEVVDMDSLNLVDKFSLYFSIEEVEPIDSSIIAAISVDNRTVKVDLIAQENILQGHSMVFLLYSDYFTGKVDPTRQSLTLSDAEVTTLQNAFRKKVAEIIESRIPSIKTRNAETKNSLINRYPHLSGYFNSDTIGYISRNDVLKKAQEQFFKAQKELLDASKLSDEQYDKAIELSARALTEYILFRQLTIDRLKNSSKADSEAELHKIFATMKVKFDKGNFVQDIYRNNAWLLDDKYVTYETVLSDKEMGDLVKFITSDETTPRDDDRPDIALVFSNDPTKVDYFDVVMVELKKRGISLEENMKTVTQLEKRARKLMKYYNNQIQRIWYYGIIEFNEDIELALTGEYKELYSCGKMYYRETKVAIQKDPEVILPIGVFMWDMDSVVNDADSRNSAFLNLIKSQFTTDEGVKS